MPTYPREITIAAYAVHNAGSPKIAWWRGILRRYDELIAQGVKVRRPKITETERTYVFDVAADLDNLATVETSDAYRRPLAQAELDPKLVAEMLSVDGHIDPDELHLFRTNDALRAREANDGAEGS